MKKYSSTKPLNYFERQKQRLSPKKYRYYFFDYLYYRGQRVGRTKSRGMVLFMMYWACMLLPISFTIKPLSMLNDTSRLIIVLPLLIVFPCVFCLLRYRSEREAALMGHYRRSAWNKIIPTWLIFCGFIIITAVELWILKRLEWL